MQFTQLADMKVSRVCLGTMIWGEQNTEAEAHEQLDYAISRGVNFLDAAEMYPVPARAETQGRTETYLGTWLKHQQRDQVIVATKVIGQSGLKWIRNGGQLNEAHIREAIEGSLKRLQTDYVDLYQIHWPDRTTPRFGGYAYDARRYQEGTPILETMKVMDALIREGKIRHYGLSNETPYGMGQFVHLAEKHGLAKPISIQNAYSLLNRTFDLHLAESSHHYNIPLLPYSPLAFGLLTGKYLGGQKPEGARLTEYPQFGQRYQSKPNVNEAVTDYAAIAKDDLTGMALRFVDSRPFVASTIIGATTVDQLQVDIDAFETQIDHETLKAIEAVHLRYPNPCP
jgi:aryl-alcohol dehydrogenase (NADP+)